MRFSYGKRQHRGMMYMKSEEKDILERIKEILSKDEE